MFFLLFCHNDAEQSILKIFFFNITIKAFFYEIYKKQQKIQKDIVSALSVFVVKNESPSEKKRFI